MPVSNDMSGTLVRILWHLSLGCSYMLKQIFGRSSTPQLSRRVPLQSLMKNIPEQKDRIARIFNKDVKD